MLQIYKQPINDCIISNTVLDIYTSGFYHNFKKLKKENDTIYLVIKPSKKHYYNNVNEMEEEFILAVKYN